MDVTTRNFFRLLRAGAFGNDEAVEPLSAWKWKRLFQLAVANRVETYALQGVKRLEGQFFLQIPEELLTVWLQCKPKNGNAIELKFSNPALQHRLKRILADDKASAETLQLLKLLVAISCQTLRHRLPIDGLISLGQYLRTNTDAIDPKLLDTWIGQLRLKRMANFIGLLLVRLFLFDATEIPFLKDSNDGDIDTVISELFYTESDVAGEWTFTQGDNIFVHTKGTSGLRWQTRHSRRYLRYHPSESVMLFFASFLRSLTNIEE